MSDAIPALNTLHSATLEGLTAHPVSVEASFTKGLPAFTIVGLTSESIKESKERVKSALLMRNYTFPPLRITISLAPSDLSKSGSHFDLPIALLIALGKQTIQLKTPFFIFGELGLDGTLKSTNQIFPLALSLAKQFPHLSLLVPKDAIESLSYIPSLALYQASTLEEALTLLQSPTLPTPIRAKHPKIPTLTLDKTYFLHQDFTLDFADVKGQASAKRAALIAAAGMHNILFSGSPGSGKSMIIKRLSHILPPIDHEEFLELALLEQREQGQATFSAKRPFRSPHHSATKASIFGGGSRTSRIGEVALAHHGLLFFDELPHFPKTILEALREPLEDHRILISRVNAKIEYPARFLFAAAMNPCPCGNLLSRQKNCRCSDLEVQRYQNRLSDPFLDRIDLFAILTEYNPQETHRISSKELYAQVLTAFKRQRERHQSTFNGKLTDTELSQVAVLNESLESFLTDACQKFALSMRARTRILKVARTIADLDNAQDIEKMHLLEALNYRKR